MSLVRNRLLASTLLGSVALLAVPAFAQTTPAPSQQAPTGVNPPTGPSADATTGADAEDTIVVTGSRIARPELDSATPVAVVGAEQIRQQGATNVQEVLARLPQVGIPGLSNTNSNFLTSGNGVSTVNLRNLGDQRTLVLVNGRRFVAGLAGTSIVDVNNIPADFIDRVEVVTGGASAIYGSDAISGVVNFVLKDNFEGLTARAQYGLTSRGDNPRYSASITGGTKFGADDRGSIIANVTYDKDTGLLSRNRSISSQDCSGLGCGPQSYSSYAAQGRFQLLNGGVGASGQNLFTFNPDNSIVDGFPTGYGFNRNAVRRISTPVERYIGNVIAKYEVADGITAFVEGTYAHTKSSAQIEPYALDSANDLGPLSADTFGGYKIDNPFIPASIAAQIAARNSDADPDNDVDEIGFRRRQNEVFSRSNRNKRDTFRIATGLRGDFADRWKYEVSYVYGQLKDKTQTEDLDLSKYLQALDAVRDPVSGNIVCRDPSGGCVPINLFGYNTASPEAAGFVASAIPRSERIKNTEQVLSGSITGPLFTLPGGDLQVSVGAEYRREKSSDDWDALTNAGLNTGNQTPDTVGKFNVKEVFGEVDIPILRDTPFFQSLSIQAAARYSDYSTIGGVFSWNAGGEWQPVTGIRLRGNYAVANRAPNIGELFQAPSETFPSVQDPCDGTTAASTNQYAAACRAIPAVAAAIANTGGFNYTLADIQQINGFDGGNTELQEEKGKTLTLGTVISPPMVRGLSLTVDYFNIKIDNAIGIIPRSTSIQQCLLTNLPQFCNNVIRNAQTGIIRTVNAQNVNIATLKTSGVDFNLSYGSRLGLFGDDRIDLNALWTYTLKYKTQSDPSAPVDSGIGNLEYGEVFKHKVTGRVSYSVGPATLAWSTTFLSKMKDTVSEEFDPEGLAPGIAEHNNIKARIYHDVQVKFNVGDNDRFEFFVGANNVFDRKPPKLEDTVFYGTITGTTTAADVYDPFGRRFYAGAQVHF